MTLFATEALVTALVTEIAAALPELHVESYPDFPGDYRLRHPLGAVLVSYLGAPSERPRLLGPSAEQVITFRLGLTLITRALWGEQGAVAYLDRLRAALHGWRPLQCDPLYHVQESLAGKDAELWWHRAEWACQSRLSSVQRRQPCP